MTLKLVVVVGLSLSATRNVRSPAVEQEVTENVASPVDESVVAVSEVGAQVPAGVSTIGTLTTGVLEMQENTATEKAAPFIARVGIWLVNVSECRVIVKVPVVLISDSVAVSTYV